jgi:hypothetical protein
MIGMRIASTLFLLEANHRRGKEERAWRSKVYGLCLKRLRHQSGNAKLRVNGETVKRFRSYIARELHHSDIEESISDVLELYDVEERTCLAVKTKLEDCTYTVSALLGETIAFGSTAKGALDRYLS